MCTLTPFLKFTNYILQHKAWFFKDLVEFLSFIVDVYI
jgi:hypothetical protein